ncbi:MAG TPA: hypothetical protein DCE56_35340 [Cyanobacteria bacterium UBA8553]|nr:hypothetical protein [Cyanobacteria bacterium UBA8553]
MVVLSVLESVEIFSELEAQKVKLAEAHIDHAYLSSSLVTDLGYAALGLVAIAITCSRIRYGTMTISR